MSTTNLSKHADSMITKRLSVSSATLLHSPDRGKESDHHAIKRLEYMVGNIELFMMCEGPFCSHVCPLKARPPLGVSLTSTKKNERNSNV